MRIALAQIDMRLGDIEAVCSRVADQAQLAARARADLLCIPAPLLSGVVPGSLVDYPNYEHDLVVGLKRLAARVEETGVACLVPAVVSCEGGSLFEVFLLREAQAVPLRSALFRVRQDTPLDPWLPPVFDIAGTRVAVTYDFDRDVAELPPGCDLLVYFQVNAFDASDVMSAPAAAIADGGYARALERAGVWLACMAPVGGFDEAVYTGGSFVMDDSGRVLALAPCFEESLLVQEVRRGCTLSALGAHELPVYNREEWTWEALRLHLRDAVQAAGLTRVAVALAGDLPSSLLAALAVDAVGPRNVIGLLSERPDALTPADEARERERCDAARAVARSLSIRLVERAGDDLARFADRPVARAEIPRLRAELEAAHLLDMARALSALPVSALCKSEYALAAEASAARPQAALAPFGDVYLSQLEFLARMRNRASAVLPPALVTLNAVEDAMRSIVELAVEGCGADAVLAGRMSAVLGALEPAQIDGALEAHVDRNLPFEEGPLAQRAPEAAATLFMLVRRGEAARRRLPMAPIVSSRAFVERLWPMQLGWSDLGRHGAERQSVADLVEAGLARFEQTGEEYGNRARDELIGLLGEFLGIPPEQMAEFATEEGQRRVRENLVEFQEQLQRALEQMERDGEGPFAAAEDAPGFDAPGAGPGGSRLFSQN